MHVWSLDSLLDWFLITRCVTPDRDILCGPNAAKTGTYKFDLTFYLSDECWTARIATA
jgi:hypothetical protein